MVRVVPAQNAVPRGHQQRTTSYPVNSLFLSTASNQMPHFKCNKARASVLLCPASLLGAHVLMACHTRRKNSRPEMNALILSLLCTRAPSTPLGVRNRVPSTGDSPLTQSSKYRGARSEKAFLRRLGTAL